jgi:nicotinamidase-related amidase
MNARTSALVLVDYQERLMPLIHDGATAVQRGVFLGRTAQVLDIPVLGTEQNPAKLGPNSAELRALCSVTLAKTHFDACEDGLVPVLRRAHPSLQQVVLAGCEAHVCLMQTALGLLRAGLQVWVVANACGSRRAMDHAAAMARLQTAGATLVTHEMVAFEWLHHCEHPRFREVLALIKAAD